MVFFPGPISSFIYDWTGPTALLMKHINNHKQTELTCSAKYDFDFVTFVFHSFLLGTVPAHTKRNIKTATGFDQYQNQKINNQALTTNIHQNKSLYEHLAL